MKTWKLVKKEVLHSDHWNDVERTTFELPKGELVKDYIIINCRAVVMAFALTKGKKLILVREYKPGANKIVTQLPAGYIDDNETLEQAAVRELAEETGYAAPKIEKIGKIFNANGKMTANVTCFIALDAKKEKEQHLDEHEEIEILTVSLEEAEKMVLNGTIDSADSAAFILMGIAKLRKQQ